jgi:hypothetical protein
MQQARASLSQGVMTGLAENRAGFVAPGDAAVAAAGLLIGDGHAGAIYNATDAERQSGAKRAGLTRAAGGRQHPRQHPGELSGGRVRQCDRRYGAPWRPAAQLPRDVLAGALKIPSA